MPTNLPQGRKAPIVQSPRAGILKTVMAEWRKLEGDVLNQEHVDFFADVLRASASCMVNFDSRNKGFAIVFESIREARRQRNLQMQRSAGSRAPKIKQNPGFSPKKGPAPVGGM